MNIAIFADVHGRVLLAFKLAARWEHERGEKIDLILQAGDLGAYPDINQLDRATIKHAKNDPTELGFSQYFVDYDADVAETLEQTSANMLFVRGNHEDHDWLDKLEQQHDGAIFPVDVYQRVWCMKSGMPHQFKSGNETINILGIGRIAALPGEQDKSKSKYIQPYEARHINRIKHQKIDLLLTHDTALNFVTVNYGMEEIRLILDIFKPEYHFHGHTEAEFNQQTDSNRHTQVIKLSDLHWNKSKAVEQGSMGILHWENDRKHQFEVISDNWFWEYTSQTWEHIQ